MEGKRDFAIERMKKQEAREETLRERERERGIQREREREEC